MSSNGSSSCDLGSVSNAGQRAAKFSSRALRTSTYFSVKGLGSGAKIGKLYSIAAPLYAAATQIGSVAAGAAKLSASGASLGSVPGVAASATFLFAALPYLIVGALICVALDSFTIPENADGLVTITKEEKGYINRVQTCTISLPLAKKLCRDFI